MSILVVESDLVQWVAGPSRLRVARFAVPPGVEVSAGPVLLRVENGVLAVPGDGVAAQELGFEARQVPGALHPGQALVISPGARYAFRAEGPVPAVVLTIAIIPA